MAASLPATAQVQTGSILVRVTDAQGGAVPGVTITLTSPVLVSGTMTAVTDTGGVNRFPSLQPGTYSVKLELQGFYTWSEATGNILAGADEFRIWNTNHQPDRTIISDRPVDPTNPGCGACFALL